MNRRKFIAASAVLVTLPASASAAEDVCLRGLEGIDVESNESPYFTHYHQLIIAVSDLVAPPKNGIKLVTGKLDQGSCDDLALQAFVKTKGIELEALRGHNHEVQITSNELERIAAGEKNVEIISW